MTNQSMQKMWLWLMVVGLMVFFGLGWYPLAGLLPPHQPSASAEEIAAIYQSNANGIRAGTLMCLFGMIFFYPYAGVIYAQMRRIEEARGDPPFNSILQLVCGACAYTIGLVFPLMMWGIAAFRPDRNVEITLVLNDLAWLFATMIFSPYIPQFLAFAIEILRDKQPVPLFPRWVGWLNVWIAVSGIPVLFIFFFKTGPFAWNGIISFWLPFGIFFVGYAITIFYLFRAVGREDYGCIESDRVSS